jgi:hypothetical protein
MGYLPKKMKYLYIAHLSNDPMGEISKKDWICKISALLDAGKIFVCTLKTSTPSQLLFACDVFRRRMHDVIINIQVNQTGSSSWHVVIHPEQNCLDLTICRDNRLCLDRVTPSTKKIRIRGCGRVIDSVYQSIDSLINNGWYLEKTMLNSSTQKNGINNHINTTLQAVLRRG